MATLTHLARRVRQTLGASPAVAKDFMSEHYLRHNQRRLEHLASLGLDLASKSVLEVGAGIGDHTHFFLDRGCTILSTDGRASNLQVLSSRYPHIGTQLLDLNAPDEAIEGVFDIVYCYGVLYHLEQPQRAIRAMSNHSASLLLLETCVSFGEGEFENKCSERAQSHSQSITGVGCRPTRAWVYSRLRQEFEFVYMPKTQPFHPEFPVDWSSPPDSGSSLTRSVYVASRRELDNPLLFRGIPMRQSR